MRQDDQRKKVRRSPRSPLDFYPTPPEVTYVAMRWLVAHGMTGPMLDPAGGDGRLIEAARDIRGEDHWSAIEIDAGRAERLELYADNVICGDALRIKWPKANIVANPPFYALDAYWKRTCTIRKRIGCYGALFAPVAWLSAEKRSGYVMPDVFMQLGWRPAFRKGTELGPAHKGSQDFAWLIVLPKPAKRTTWIRVSKPV